MLASAFTSLARAEDNTTQKDQHYTHCRTHIQNFDEITQSLPNTTSEKIIADIRSKTALLAIFDFEATVCLKAWDDLSQIVRRAESLRVEEIYKAMGDVLLTSQAPTRGTVTHSLTGKRLTAAVMFATMRLIIDRIFSLGDFDSAQLSKYIRCLFQTVLAVDDQLAAQLLDQAIEINAKAAEVSQHKTWFSHQTLTTKMGKSFEPIEVEWLVATSFNHAIDHYSRHEEDTCHQWAMKALELARFIGDNGVLLNTIQQRLAKLQFRGKGVITIE